MSSEPDLRPLAALIDAGDPRELEAKARALLERYPLSGSLWQALSVSLARQGKDALDALHMAARLLPNDAVAHHNLGNAYARRGDLTAAEAQYRRALSLRPDFAEAHNNLGQVLLDLGRADEARDSCRRAVALKSDYAAAHDNLGIALLALGDAAGALSSHRRALQIDPGSADAHNNLGNALAEIGRSDDALTSYRRALQVHPQFAEAYNNLGNVLRNLGRLDEASASYRKALEIDPQLAAAHCNLGLALRLQGRTEAARASCRRALSIEHRSAAAYMILAESSADRGEFAEAEALFERAIEIEPDSPEPWAGIVRVRKMTLEDARWLTAARRIASRPLPPGREIGLRFALGKYFDDVQDYDQAFANFRRANELTKLRRAGHDRQQVTRSVDFAIRAFDREWVRRLRPDALQSARPVFIVGMLRSGTSLAEQILASHPAAFGAGELPYWNGASAAYEHRAALAPADDGALCGLARDYLGILHGLSADALRVCDKMPANFRFLGLAHAALPNARIIHLRRDPAATCFSIYSQHFETAVSYANDLDDLAHYYREYLRLMNHWQATLPEDAILDVPYEGLVADPEAWSRRMVQFIGLPWDPRCLEFDRSGRTVITASKWQVRQTIHTSSVERWRNYRKFLQPLLSAVPAVPSNFE